jgi:16S rRNA A1518/A1519 N6-dimethyltransferase RsmA/KsgA/DIM1 with predicted DNA glycosylase/AP lyase activity
LEKAGEVLAIEMDARLVDFLCERFGLTTQADELPALSPEERENILDTSIDSTLLDSSQRGAGESSADKIPPQNLFLLHDDALAFIKREPRDWSDWKLVANLPYSVASPILVELAQSPKRPERMVTTLQLEVAQRLMARADDDDYGVLTLLVQLDYEPRDSFKIPADCFFPAPNVDSMCVVLQRRARPLLADGQRAAFVKIVKRAFSQRRKMMLKLLKQDWAVDKLTAAFAELKISPQERAEKLSLEQFVALTKILFSHG